MPTNERDLTERLAKAMGWEYWPDFGEWTTPQGAHVPDCEFADTFSPLTSRDDFDLVLAEVERRGKTWEYCDAMYEANMPQTQREFFWFLSHPPLPVACECALKALEGSHE